jgi:hypothetical protein
MPGRRYDKDKVRLPLWRIFQRRLAMNLHRLDGGRAARRADGEHRQREQSEQGGKRWERAIHSRRLQSSKSVRLSADRCVVLR